MAEDPRPPRDEAHKRERLERSIFDRIHRSPRIPDRYASWRAVNR